MLIKCHFWYSIKNLFLMYSTGISSELRTNLCDWAAWQARAGCYSQAAVSSYDSKTLYVYSCYTQLSIFSAAISTLVAIITQGCILGISAYQSWWGANSIYPSWSWNDFVSAPRVMWRTSHVCSINRFCKMRYFSCSLSAYRFLGFSSRFLRSISHHHLLFRDGVAVDIDRRWHSFPKSFL